MTPAQRYRGTRFLTSAHTLKQLPPESGPEVAVAGRSNAGKSTAINVVTGIKNLARTSKTPGRTQLINFFDVDEAHRLVDLPGYGYAKVPPEVRRHWQRVLGEFLQRRQALRGLLLVMDVRHPLTEYDQQMLGWCHASGMPVHILLTKADKLKRGPGMAALAGVRRALATDFPETTAQLFSGLKRQGVEEVHAVLDRWFDYPEREGDQSAP